MHTLRSTLARLRELFRPRARHAADQDDEFRFHLDMETAENVRRGMSEADARRAAVIRFGGAQRFREETTDARGVVSVDNLARDARFAFRRLHRAPTFAAGVIATLGVGIGTAAGIGAIVYGVLLRELPYPDPGRLVRVGFHTDGIPATGDQHSDVTFIHFAKTARSFTDLGAYWTNDAFTLTDGDAPERVTIAMATPSLFTMLGVRPVVGQLFEPGDTSWTNGRSPILISQELWERRYGADPKIVGRQIAIDRGVRTVVGVLPRAFDFPSSAVAVWYPAVLYARQPQISLRTLVVVGRLRDDVSAESAAAELNALVPALATRYPVLTADLLKRSGARVSVASLQSATVAPVRPQLLLLGVLVAVVLLIATTNVANLFLLRTERASREIAIALSLGAARLALAQRFAIEGVVLGLAASVVAVPAAALVASTKFGFTERDIPRLSEVTFTPGTFGVVVGGAALIGGLMGLIGLGRTGLDGLADRLRAVRSTAGRTWRRSQDGLVAFQVAVALMLLVAAGLLGRSFWNLRTAAIGFAPDGVTTFHVSLPYREGYTTYSDHVAIHARVMDRLAALPGVTNVAAALELPLNARGQASPTMQLQAGDPSGAPIAVTGNMASADYFKAMRIPLRAGRSFQAGDLRGTPAVVVSERVATSLFGTTAVVGRTITRLPPRPNDPPATFVIVGIVGDVQRDRIEDGFAPMVYFPLLRDNDGLPADSNGVPYRPRSVDYVIRGAQIPAPTIHALMKALDRNVPPTAIRTLGSIVDDATARVRLTMLLIAVAGAAALLLGVIGVYSVVSYAAAGRVREFGIRIALGAAPRRVGSMVLGDGLKLVAIGTVAGLVAAVSVTRFLRALLYEVEPTSVTEFALATGLMVAVTVLATAIPARRAARTDPAGVLRGE